MSKFTVSCLLLMVLAPSAALSAGERGTPAEAKAMLQKAVAHYKAVGRKQALADFNGKKPPFVDRDLYVVCIGPDYTIVADGGFPQYVGYSSEMWKDLNGKSVGKTGFDIAHSRGQAEVHYKWLNPVTHRLENKVTFFAKTGADTCGVGAYSAE